MVSPRWWRLLLRTDCGELKKNDEMATMDRAMLLTMTVMTTAMLVLLMLLMRLLRMHERFPPCSSLPQAKQSCWLQLEHCDMCELKSVTW